MGKFVKVVGYALLFAGALFILAGYIGAYLKEGFAGVQDLLSPFNVWNFAAVILTLAPGAALVWLGDWLIGRRQKP